MFTADKKLEIIRRLKVEKFIPNKVIIPLYYEHHMNKKLNLRTPKTFSEKLQWLKIYYKNPVMTQLVDKIAVREYVEHILGKEYLIPLIGIYEKFDDINFDALPQRFVIKCNHDSGSYIVCPNKDELDIEWAREKINKHMAGNYYYYWREWPYKNVRPQILIEEYMEDISLHNFNDYKFLCFNGKVDNILVCVDRQNDIKKYYFDRDWNFKKYTYESVNADEDFTFLKPNRFDEMLEIVEKLAGNFPCIRVDLYCINSKIYFGELTFFPNAGFNVNLLEDVNLKWGNQIKLEKYSAFTPYIKSCNVSNKYLSNIMNKLKKSRRN